MRNEPSTPTLEELKKRHTIALMRSDSAVCARPAAYRRLKERLRRVIVEVVDVDAYHERALSLTVLLRELSGACPGSIFDHFLQRIDPARGGRARYLRLDCRDLQAHLADLDFWRMTRRRIRRVK